MTMTGEDKCHQSKFNKDRQINRQEGAMISTITVKRPEIESLAARLNARGESVVLSDQPEMQKDLRLAARVIRAFVKKHDGEIEMD